MPWAGPTGCFPARDPTFRKAARAVLACVGKAVRVRGLGAAAVTQGRGMMVRGGGMAVTVAVLGTLILAGCAGSPSAPGGGRGGYYKVGKPYQIKGIWYYPAEDYAYDETGIASWYGPGFHAKMTANGETYDQMDLTAAHKTLPMPSLVRVTNLDNGRSIVVRVNDRGPYVNNRVIDMSQRRAQLLGFDRVGTAKVRVQILADESRALADAARRGQTPPVMTAQVDKVDTPPPVQAAAPRPSIQVSEAPPPAARPSGIAVAELPPSSTARVPGKTEEDGRFMPAPVVSSVPVKGQHRIYIQAGAFSVAENAQKLSGRLGSIGTASVTQATVNGRQFYRVRVGPLDDVDRADTILNQVIQSGLTDAKIVVD